MNKKSFLRQLSFRLIFMNKEQKQSILDYYSEMIDDYVEDGYSEEEAVKKLGDIKDIVRDIKEANGEKQSMFDYPEKQFDIDMDAINEIDFSLINRGINIEKSEDDQIHLEYNENERDRIEIEIEDQKLIVKNIVESNNVINFMINNTIVPHMTLFLPEHNNKIIIVNTKNGGIKVKGALNFKEASINTTNGGININNLYVLENLKVSTKNGGIKVQNTSAHNINLSTSNGGINLIHIDSNTDIISKTSNGIIYFEHIYSTKNIYFLTANSSIRGNIDDSMSNYSIETSTTNGKSNLPNKFGSGDKKLAAHTSNGSINIIFNK